MPHLVQTLVIVPSIHQHATVTAWDGSGVRPPWHTCCFLGEVNNAVPFHPTVLVVEDDDGMRSLLERFLSHAGLAVTSASRGHDALDLLRLQRFDVLILDITLPDINGLVIGERARELYHNQIVIIVITGEQIRSRKLVALELFADDFLQKPVAMDELIARIQAKLRRLAAE
jgi:DNA-binding response OmpR family regulator